MHAHSETEACCISSSPAFISWLFIIMQINYSQLKWALLFPCKNASTKGVTGVSSSGSFFILVTEKRCSYRFFFFRGAGRWNTTEFSAKRKKILRESFIHSCNFMGEGKHCHLPFMSSLYFTHHLCKIEYRIDHRTFCSAVLKTFVL